MKTKITLLIALAIALLSFTLTSRNVNHSKTSVKKTPQESRVNKGLVMEDRNQFN